MSGETRVIPDPEGTLRPLLDGLEILVSHLVGVRYALIGGLAVFARADVPRATSDIDTVISITRHDLRQVMGPVSKRLPGRLPSFALPNDVQVDVIVADPTGRAPRPGLSRRKVAHGLATTWAIETASTVGLDTDPARPRGIVQAMAATTPALIAMKSLAFDHPLRADSKRDSDLLDLWMLLAERPQRAVHDLRTLFADAPSPIAEWVRAELTTLFRDDQHRLVSSLADFVKGPLDRQDVEETWNNVIAPALSDTVEGAGQ